MIPKGIRVRVTLVEKFFYQLHLELRIIGIDSKATIDKRISYDVTKHIMERTFIAI